MLALFPWKAIGPCPHETRVPKRTSGYRVACRMAYPYFWIQSALLFRPSSLDLPWGSAYPAKPLVVPTTFVFGKNKRAQFHTKGFLERMEKADGYSVVELDCGHFIQVQKPDEVEAAIRQRMAG